VQTSSKKLDNEDVPGNIEASENNVTASWWVKLLLASVWQDLDLSLSLKRPNSARLGVISELEE